MPDAVNATTIPRYLCGDKHAIQTLLECPRALWLGLIFVLSAGFAREYDAESLLHEPWYLLIPVGASLLTSFLLYALLYGAAVSKGAQGRGFWELYPTFLTLYWMTAPLAWLYAFPVERILPPLEAAQVNYALLAIVSVWRVLLISRATSFVFSAPFGLVLCLVLLFADTIVLIASITMPQPVFQVMGGVRLNAMEQLNAEVAGMACCFSTLLWPIMFVTATGYFSAKGNSWSMPAKPDQPRSIHRTAWLTAGLSVAVWAGILPFTQPEQYLRFQVERELIHGDVRKGLAMMSEHQRDDFPPDWSPPPYWGERVYRPELADVLTVISSEPVADWVAEMYWSIADERFEEPALYGISGPRLDSRRRAFAVYLDKHSDRDRLIRENASDLRQYIQMASHYHPDGDEADTIEEFKRLLQSVPGEDLLNEPSPEQHD